MGIREAGDGNDTHSHEVSDSQGSADTWAWLLWTYHGFLMEAALRTHHTCYGWAWSGLEPRKALQVSNELAHFWTSTGIQKHMPASHAHIHGWSTYCVPPMHRDSHRHACCLQPTQANQTHKTGGMHEVDWCNTEQAGGHSGWFPGLLRNPHTQYDTSCICWLMTETPQLESHSSGLGCLHPCKKCRHHKEGKHFTPDQPPAPKCACLCQLSPEAGGKDTGHHGSRGVQTGLVMQWKGQNNAECSNDDTEVTFQGTSLVVQWLRICLAMQGTWIWSLVGELRSHMPQSK